MLDHLYNILFTKIALFDIYQQMGSHHSFSLKIRFGRVITMDFIVINLMLLLLTGIHEKIFPFYQ